MGINLGYAVRAVVDCEKSLYLGTAFLFRRSDRALTAAHVVSGREAADLGLAGNGTSPSQAHRIDRLICHPQADVAVLHLAGEAPAGAALVAANIFLFIATDHHIGEEFATSGWNDLDGGSRIEAVPGPRMQQGSIERVSYCVRPPHAYHCAELSLNTRRGLSGAPMFRQRTPMVVGGVITGNERTERPIDSYEEEREGEKVRVERVEVVHTGIAMLFNQADPWLQDQFPGEEIYLGPRLI